MFCSVLNNFKFILFFFFCFFFYHFMYNLSIHSYHLIYHYHRFSLLIFNNMYCICISLRNLNNYSSVNIGRCTTSNFPIRPMLALKSPKHLNYMLVYFKCTTNFCQLLDVLNDWIVCNVQYTRLLCFFQKRFLNFSSVMLSHYAIYNSIKCWCNIKCSLDIILYNVNE